MAGVVSNLISATNSFPLLLAEIPVALVQVTAFFSAWIGCWLPLAIGCGIAINWRPPQPLTIEQKLPLLASLYLIVPLILSGSNWILGTSFSDYGLVWNLSLLSSIGIGFGLGVASLLILFSVQTALGWVSWHQDKQNVLSVLLPTFLLAFWISGTEELVFRGFVQTQLQQNYKLVVAAAISSLIFALLHLVWEQRETLPQIPGLWLMGMVLVLARWIDHSSLGLAWGLHTGWVWAIASLDSLQIIQYTGTIPEWVTGKNGKPLAGAVGIFCLLATGVMIWMIR